jgi:hypothetical protein
MFYPPSLPWFKWMLYIYIIYICNGTIHENIGFLWFYSDFEDMWRNLCIYRTNYLSIYLSIIQRMG